MADQAEQSNLDKIEMAFFTKTSLQSSSCDSGTGEPTDDEWITVQFTVDEYIGRPYFGTVDILSDDKSIDYSKLLGRSCLLQVKRGKDRVRKFKGIVYRVELLGTQLNKSAAKVNFAPALHALDHGKNSRIFEDMTAPEIIESVLKEGLAPFEREVKMQVTGKYAVREYCVQYRETDLNFVQRLMIDEGLTCYFDQNTGPHETLVMVDSNEAHVEVETMGGKKVEVEEIKQLEDWATAGQTALDASNFVEIELTDEDGNPIPDAQYQLKLPNGRVTDYKLNKDGWDSVPIQKNTACQISIKNQLGWTPKGQEGSPAKNEAGEEAKEYQVKQCDCLSSIAFENGLTWQQLWEHPKNKGLQDLRKDPSVLVPGDKVFIPEKQVRWEKCAINAKSSFVAKRPTEEFQMVLVDAEGKPRPGLSYKFEIDGAEVLSEVTDDQALIKCNVPANAKKALLTITVDGEEEEQHEFIFGYLDPVTEVTGVQARLNTLGYRSGEIDGDLGPQTKSSLSRFQRHHGLEPTGELTEETQKALHAVHLNEQAKSSGDGEGQSESATNNDQVESAQSEKPAEQPKETPVKKQEPPPAKKETPADPNKVRMKIGTLNPGNADASFVSSLRKALEEAVKSNETFTWLDSDDKENQAHCLLTVLVSLLRKRYLIEVRNADTTYGTELGGCSAREVNEDHLADTARNIIQTIETKYKEHKAYEAAKA